MKLEGLKELYKSMKQQGIERYKFGFRFHKVKFDVLYFIDEVPNILAFGIKNHNFYFEIPVKKGFEIEPYFNNHYGNFCRIMGFKFNPEQPFRPVIFFEQFNNKVPLQAKASHIPRPSEIAVYRNNVEEAEKIYFKGWLDNNISGNSVNPKNLEKTKKLLSYEAYLRCKKKNISSRWSPHSKDEKPFELPK